MNLSPHFTFDELTRTGQTSLQAVNRQEAQACMGALTALATLAAFISGYAAIAWLLRWLSRHGMLIFLLYRCALGGLLIVLLVTGRVAAQ